MTITDIARMAGVSASTVSKIINGKDEHINPQTRTRVLEIVKEYNFTPYSTVKNISPTKNFFSASCCVQRNSPTICFTEFCMLPRTAATEFFFWKATMI